MRFQWEIINKSSTTHNRTGTYRAKVMGGWLVRNEVWPSFDAVSTSMVFISDKDHRWKIP
jgi:hypothetical protein